MSALRPDLANLQKQLDEMPDRAVIVDEYGDAWQKSGYLGYWYRAFDGDGVDSFHLMGRVTTGRIVEPGRVVFRPSRKAGQKP